MVRGYHCPPVQQPYWNTIFLSDFPDDELLNMIDLAYDTVFSKFSKKEQKRILDEEYLILWKRCLRLVEVKFYDSVDDCLLKFAVIIAKTDNKWVFCKHKERNTYEVPGGHREDGEVILETAKRELKEETGAVEFDIKPICVYSVKGKTRVNEQLDDESFGMLYYADINSFEELHSEIETILITDKLIDSWTYPLIQPKLIEEAQKRGFI